jgi:hypothetical protein
MQALQSISMPLGFIKYKNKFKLTDTDLVVIMLLKFLIIENQGIIDHKVLAKYLEMPKNQIDQIISKLISRSIIKMQMLKINDKQVIKYSLKDFEDQITNIAIDETQKIQKVTELERINDYVAEFESTLKRKLNVEEIKQVKRLLIQGLNLELLNHILAENKKYGFGQINMVIQKLMDKNIKTVDQYTLEVENNPHPNKNRLNLTLDKFNWLKKGD